MIGVFKLAWDKRRAKYLAEEGQQMKGWKHDELAKAFAAHGINYEQEIFPVFFERWWGFLHLWAGRKAARETAKEYQEWMKPYQAAVKLIVQKKAPFSEDIKKRLENWPPPLRLSDILLREARAFIEKDQGIKILDTNVDKPPQKHPVWRDLQRELGEILSERSVSQRQTNRLIALLFRTLLPEWFDSEHLEDSVRLNRAQTNSKRK